MHFFRHTNTGWSAHEARLCFFDETGPAPLQPEQQTEQIAPDPNPEIAQRMKANAELMRQNQPAIDRAMDSYRQSLQTLTQNATNTVRQQMSQEWSIMAQTMMAPQMRAQMIQNFNARMAAAVRALVQPQLPNFKRTQVARINANILQNSGVRAAEGVTGGTFEQSAANLHIISAENGMVTLPESIQTVLRSQSERLGPSQQKFIAGLMRSTGIGDPTRLQMFIRGRPDLLRQLTAFKAPFIRTFNQELRSTVPPAPGRYTIDDPSNLNLGFDPGADTQALQGLQSPSAAPVVQSLNNPYAAPAAPVMQAQPLTAPFQAGVMDDNDVTPVPSPVLQRNTKAGVNAAAMENMNTQTANEIGMKAAVDAPVAAPPAAGGTMTSVANFFRTVFGRGTTETTPSGNREIAPGFTLPDRIAVGSRLTLPPNMTFSITTPLNVTVENVTAYRDAQVGGMHISPNGTIDGSANARGIYTLRTPDNRELRFQIV